MRAAAQDDGTPGPFLAALPYLERRVLEMRLIERKSLAEIARALNITETRVVVLEGAGLHRLTQLFHHAE